MAVKLADAVAYLTTDDTELKKGMSSAEGEMERGGNKFGSILQGIGMSVGMGIANVAMSAVGQVTAFMGESIGAASDMGETVSKTNVLFGDSAAALLSWAETASTALGQSKQQALDASTQFATFGKAAGLSGDDLVKFSTGFTGLATDLASFNNTSPEQAIQAIGAALRGESEPLRAYGVLLDDASMRQAALSLGIIDNVKNALTPQQKVLAAQKLIYDQTSAAQGDFARTSDGLANQQRILDAQMANLKATVGEALLPVILAITSAFNALVQQVLPPLTTFIRNEVVPQMTAIGNVIKTYLGPMIDQAKQWFNSLGTVMNTQTNGPMNYLSGWFYQNMPRIQQIVNTVVTALTQFWEDHGERITAIVKTLFGWMTAFWDTQFRTILNIVQAALQLLTGDFEGAGQTIKGILNDWRILFERVFRELGQMILKIDWGGIGRGIIDGIIQGIRRGIGAIGDAARDAAEAAKQAALDLLGISSPSSVAAAEIGVPFAQGIGVGISDELQRMTSSVGAGINGMLGGIQPAAAGAAGGAISITLNISGYQDGAGVGGAARDGVLSALRATGRR